MTATATQPKPDALTEIIRECRLNHTTIEASAEELLKRVQSDPLLYAALLGPYELAAAKEAIMRSASHERHRVWNKHPAQSHPKTSVAALVRGNSAALLDFPILGNLPLRSASRADVEKAAKVYLTQAADMGAKGRWLERIAKTMPASGTVGDHFAEQQLLDLREE